MTNGDRIRAMTDEELARFIAAASCCQSSHSVGMCGWPCKGMTGDYCFGLKPENTPADCSLLKREMDWLTSESNCNK